MIKEVVEAEIIELLKAKKSRFLGQTVRRRRRKRINRIFQTWMSIEPSPWKTPAAKLDGSYCANVYRCLVAECEGGAWSYFGQFYITEDEINVELKTINGIMRSRSEFHKLKFEYSNPAFPDNFIKIIKDHAIACNVCFRLKHERHCRRWTRVYDR